MQPLIRFTIITLFPEALRPYLDSSMLFKAQDRGILKIDYVNLRDFGLGPHRSVDDTPYGGGDGMLLRYSLRRRRRYAPALRTSICCD